jgi:hypothetical protein
MSANRAFGGGSVRPQLKIMQYKQSLIPRLFSHPQFDPRALVARSYKKMLWWIALEHGRYLVAIPGWSTRRGQSASAAVGQTTVNNDRIAIPRLP